MGGEGGEGKGSEGRRGEGREGEGDEQREGGERNEGRSRRTNFLVSVTSLRATPFGVRGPENMNLLTSLL